MIGAFKRRRRLAICSGAENFHLQPDRKNAVNHALAYRLACLGAGHRMAAQRLAPLL